MATIAFQKPLDQPSGSWRLLEDLKVNLDSTEFDSFRIIVAYAKLSPLLKLESRIKSWNLKGRSISAIFGIDQKGTSKEALDFAIAHFHEAYIAHVPKGAFNPTFHSKIYLFTGQEKAVAYVGSNNLTVGGTETNFESLVRVEMDLPQDADVLDQLLACWADSLAVSKPLDKKFLAALVESGLVCSEAQMIQRPGAGKGQGSTHGQIAALAFPGITTLPPSPLPKGNKPAKKPSGGKGQKGAGAAGVAILPAQALVIQVVPHHNGEVFLSKIAANQNPAFFGWPFTGATTPKNASNPAYPQREPDPVVNLNVYDSAGSLIISHPAFDLNTVYYSAKSEIRITVPQDVVVNTPEYSIMVMRLASSAGAYDYDIDIYVPGSAQYATYLAVCNQTMPSGGKPVARKFGWL